MLAAIDTAQTVQQQIDTVPTLVVGIITALSLPIATVFVAWISRRGDRRTDKSDRVPDVIAILTEQVADLKEDRDQWKLLAMRQVDKSAEETEASFPTSTWKRPE